MSSGVKSAPGIYQRLIDSLFASEPHVVYPDDILVTFRTGSEHMENLDRVLKKISDHGMRLRLDTCKFMMDSATYLGHTIDLRAYTLHWKRSGPSKWPLFLRT